MKKALLGTIIDGTGQKPIEDGMVMIEDDRIVQVSKRDESLLQGVEVLGNKDLTILPGFIDVHVHIRGVRTMNYALSLLTEPVQLQVLRASADCRAFIEAGFTSVRDVGGYGIYLNQAILDGEIPGPRISSSGKGLSQTGGHFDVHHAPYDFVKSNHPTYRICDGVDECRRAAREQLREGAHFLKIATTGGVMSKRDLPRSSQFSLEEISAIVEEADKVGAYVASHAQGAEGIKNALKAGVKTIEHGFYLDDESIASMLEKEAILVPTLAVIHRLCRGEEYNAPEWGVRKAKVAQQAHRESILKAKDAGVKIACGTDFLGPPLTPFTECAEELELMVQLGFSPMEAILSYTKIGAQVMQMEDQIGTIEEGKLADIILVEGNPLEDISSLKNTSTIKVVMKGGRVEKNIL